MSILTTRSFILLLSLLLGTLAGAGSADAQCCRRIVRRDVRLLPDAVRRGKGVSLRDLRSPTGIYDDRMLLRITDPVWGTEKSPIGAALVKPAPTGYLNPRLDIRQ